MPCWFNRTAKITQRDTNLIDHIKQLLFIPNFWIDQFNAMIFKLPAGGVKNSQSLKEFHKIDFCPLPRPNNVTPFNA